MDKFKYWLRWAGVLPISILAGALVTIPLHLILYQTLSGGVSPLITPYPELPEKILTPFFVALITVWVASIVAPRYKYRVSVVFAVAWVFVSGIGMAMGYFGVQSSNLQFSLIGGGMPILMGVIGSFAAVYHVKKKQDDYDGYEYDLESGF